MYKKKELLLVLIIIASTILVIFFNQPAKDSTTNIIKNNYVNVKLTGEVLNEKDASVDIPTGYPLSFAIVSLEKYFNEFSVRDFDLNKKIYEDTTIEVKSKDLNNKYDGSSTKININTASLDELLTLFGVGEARALKIIENREITSFTELKKIIGVSDNVITKIKEQAILQ